ncbi:germ cell nuclear acidic protein-like [Impatiens glandulifera]|uniref:germ cell nuclear acidic protein-like n=1 Tax=Impatiens glandulifera TaxID=253017 RepID=UPI001FB1885D|nr:germ cell nuclear acidic protein-like [Impatiens glandulifera]
MDSRNYVPVACRTRLQVNRSYQAYSKRCRIEARNRRRAKKLSRTPAAEDHREINLVEISDSEEDAGGGGDYRQHYMRHCDFRNRWKNGLPVRSKLGNTSREMNDAAAVNHQSWVSSPCSQVNIQCISSDSELESNDGGESESARKSSPWIDVVSDHKEKSSYDEKEISSVLPITLSDDDDEQDSGQDIIEPKEDHHPSANESGGGGGDDWKWRPMKKRYKFDDLLAKDLVPISPCDDNDDDEQQPDKQEDDDDELQLDKQECPGLPMNSSLEDMDDEKDKLLEEMNLSPETTEILLTHSHEGGCFLDIYYLP